MSEDHTTIDSEKPTAPNREATTVAAAGDGERTDPLLGTRIGNFSIKSVIGTGGMGAVYLAVQENPHRKVALKVMKRGIASRSALRRFEFESQILARLRHPNIAQVHEAGTHDDGAGGVPYFAMEYVPNAKTIVDYAKTKKLGTRERLALFARVCDAVHHGHQKGIIHRDLKPANILVDSAGEPKIIDFGVARATDSDLAVTTLQTDIGQLIGTLQYMSPEQCEASPDDLDTRSDVYALGVILYELLTEKLPYDLTRTVLHEAARVIREDSPVRLSTLNRALRGDVETITAKAMEKERERRYKSAEALADDLRHYLNTEPIQARPPSAAYQLNRFARRNKPLVIGAALVLLVLVAGVVATGLALVRALDAEDLAQTRLTRAEMAEGEATKRADELETLAGELEQVAEFQSAQLGGIDVPLMGSRIRDDILAETRVALVRAGTNAAEIDERMRPLEEVLADTSFTDVALATLDDNVFAGALAALDDDEYRDQPLVRARLLHTLAETMRKLGLLDRATAPQEEALAIRRRELGDDHADTLMSMAGMAGLLEMQAKFDEAERYWRDVLDGSRRVLGEDHPDTLVAMSNMGLILYRQGKLDEAEPLRRDTLAAMRRVFGDDAPETLIAINDLGQLLQAQGKRAEAEPYARQTLTGYRVLFGDDHPHTLVALNNLGTLLADLGQFAEAEPFQREALDGNLRVLGRLHASTLSAMSNMGYLLLDLDRPDEAETLFREALAGKRQTLGSDHPSTLVTINALGGLLVKRGRYAEAEPILRECVTTGDRVVAGGHWRIEEARSRLGESLAGLGRFDEAEPVLLRAYEGFQATLSGGRRAVKLPPAVERLLKMYEAWGKPEKAAEWRAELAKIALEAVPSPP